MTEYNVRKLLDLSALLSTTEEGFIFPGIEQSGELGRVRALDAPWPVRSEVAAGVKALAEAIVEVSGIVEDVISKLDVENGWIYQVDSEFTEAARLVVDDERVVLSVDGLGDGSVVDQWPEGESVPWDVAGSSIVAGLAGDSWLLRLEFNVQNGGGQTKSLDVGLMAGGVDMLRSSLRVQSGINTITRQVVVLPFFVDQVAAENGVQIFLDSSETRDDLAVWDVALYLQRVRQITPS